MMKLLIDEIDNVLSPIGGSGRVKYTCLDVSKRYLVLGANTGSLYFFERKSTSTIINKTNQIVNTSVSQVVIPNTGIVISSNSFNNDNLSFTQILSFNDVRDPIQSIKINPTNENLVTICTLKTIYVIEPNISTRREKEKIIFKITDHPKDSEITCIAWSPCGGYVFSGDTLGNVYCSSLLKGKRSLFSFSADLVIKCDSRLVQLDVLSVKPSLEVALTQVPHIAVALLASTLTKSSVITYQVNQTNYVGKILGIVNIGKKQRENTKQGACFHKFYRNSLYASRPGKRLWLADRLDGKVLNTLNFSPEEGQTLIKPKPLCNDQLAAQNPITGNFPMIFSKLLPYGNLVISWDEKSLLLIDVNSVDLLEWRLDINQVYDVCIHEGSIYVLHGQSRSISRVCSSLPLPSNPVLDDDIVVHELPQQPIEEQKDSKEQENIQQQTQPIPSSTIPSNTTTDITDYSNTETSTNDSNVNTDTDNISLTNSTGSINDVSNIDENTNITPTASTTVGINNSNETQKENILPTTVVPAVPAVPTTTTATTTTTVTNTLPPRQGSKVNLFSDIQLSSEPLVALTSGGTSTIPKDSTPQPRKTVIKKKVIKVKETDKPTTLNPVAAVTTSPTSSTPPTDTPDDKNSTNANPNEAKRTVIIKKKIVKKPKSATETTPENSSVSSPPNTTPTNSSTNTTPEKKTTATTTTTTTAIPAATDASNIGHGLFNTAVSSLQKINQIANKIQKQTSEITSDLTHKILGGHETNATGENLQVNEVSSQQTTITSPIIEDTPLEILEKLTKKTHSALLEFKSQKNESTFIPLLQIWISSFYNCIDISNSGNENQQVLPSDQINDIVTACFLLGINLSSKECNDKICKCWDENQAIEFIKQYCQYLDSNKVIMNCNLNNWDECINILLDTELKTLSKQESKVIATINQFVDSGNSTSVFTILEQQSSNFSMLFRYLKVLINLDSLKAAAFFSKNYPTITPHNVFIHMTNTNNASSKIEYLRHLVTEHQDCKYDSTLIMEWFTTCISQLPEQLRYSTDLIEGDDRVPILNSHTIEWKHRDTMMTIIQNIISNEYFGSIENIERQSKDNGFWEGLFKIYLHCYESYSSKSLTYNQEISDNYARKAIDLSIFTDNKLEFIKFFENNTNIKHWSIVLSSMENLRNIYGNVSFEISELLISKIMGRAIGPLQTIELISNSKLFESQDSIISPLVLSEWIRNGKWSLYNRSKLSYDILNGLDSHLWLKKPLTISPQILSLIGPEIDKSIPSHPFVNNNDKNEHHHHHHNETINEKATDKFEFGIMPQFFEDNARRHWGIETELHTGVCLICTLPLSENPESSFLGSTPAIIIVFPNCGHAYHQVCIEEQGCALCFSKR